MKVYVVTEDYDTIPYSGSEIIGIFMSEESAFIAKRTHRDSILLSDGELPYGKSVNIEEWEVE